MILGTIDCDQYKNNFVDLYLAVKKLYRPDFLPNQKILIRSRLDYYRDSQPLILQSLQKIVNDVDITNCFVCFETTNKNIDKEYKLVHETFSTDPTTFEIKYIEGDFLKLPAENIKPYSKISSIESNSDKIKDLTEEQKNLLFRSKNFCILPWISMHVNTKSNVAPCCLFKEPVGDCSKNSLQEIWNNQKQQDTRAKMLKDLPVPSCRSCINQEKLGKDSLRTTSNVVFSQHIHIAKSGVTPDYNLKYIDSRWNNLCNLSCRSCGPADSSTWHAPSVAIGQIDKNTPVFLKAGRNKTDLYDQMIEQIDNLERIYFAGGEPLIMQENYDILDELDKRQRHDIQLVYNTNMTRSSLKGRSIFDAWKNFKNISIGASLDAEGARATYLRTGTIWQDVVDFRKDIIAQRPDIDFYISATTSIINVLHVPDFHRSWVKKGYIKPEQFRIQTVFWPSWMKVETAPANLREKIKEKYNLHLDWLRSLDPEGRATQGYESILNQLENPVTFNAEEFWKHIDPLDRFYKANLIESFPELVDLPR